MNNALNKELKVEIPGDGTKQIKRQVKEFKIPKSDKDTTISLQIWKKTEPFPTKLLVELDANKDKSKGTYTMYITDRLVSFKSIIRSTLRISD